jgi:hypothetical protein
MGQISWRRYGAYWDDPSAFPLTGAAWAANSSSNDGNNR